MSTVKEEFEFFDNSGTHSITSENVLCCADTGRVVAVFYNERDLRAATGLIKKVELIHGKAYQFKNIEENTINGLYDDDEHSFKSLNVEWSAQTCTNIQLLEVK